MNARKPLTQTMLDRLPCQSPGCDNPGPHNGHALPMFFHARCHRGEGTRVSYRKGILTIVCRMCSALVAEVEVAP